MESRATTSIPHEQVLTNPHLLAEVLSRVADPVFGWDPVLWGLCAQVSKLWRAEMRLQPLDLGFETNLKLAVNTQLPIRRLRFPSPLEREHDAGDECTVLACPDFQRLHGPHLQHLSGLTSPACWPAGLLQAYPRLASLQIRNVNLAKYWQGSTCWGGHHNAQLGFLSNLRSVSLTCCVGELDLLGLPRSVEALSLGSAGVFCCPANSGTWFGERHDACIVTLPGHTLQSLRLGLDQFWCCVDKGLLLASACVRIDTGYDLGLFGTDSLAGFLQSLVSSQITMRLEVIARSILVGRELDDGPVHAEAELLGTAHPLRLFDMMLLPRDLSRIQGMLAACKGPKWACIVDNRGSDSNSIVGSSHLCYDLVSTRLVFERQARP